jgi:hypothetical protein
MKVFFHTALPVFIAGTFAQDKPHAGIGQMVTEILFAQLAKWAEQKDEAGSPLALRLAWPARTSTKVKMD